MDINLDVIEARANAATAALIAYIRERDRIAAYMDFTYGDIYDEDGYCVACGNGACHMTECTIAMLQDHIMQLQAQINDGLRLDEGLG